MALGCRVRSLVEGLRPGGARLLEVGGPGRDGRPTAFCPAPAHRRMVGLVFRPPSRLAASRPLPRPAAPSVHAAGAGAAAVAGPPDDRRAAATAQLEGRAAAVTVPVVEQPSRRRGALRSRRSRRAAGSWGPPGRGGGQTPGPSALGALRIRNASDSLGLARPSLSDALCPAAWQPAAGSIGVAAPLP